MRLGLRAISPEAPTSTFEEFVAHHELGLKRALVAAVGVDAGLEATAEALAYGWEHWQRIGRMENPGGYLYRVGRSRARSAPQPPVDLPRVEDAGMPWVEPALPAALANLPEQQRTAVLLVHTFGYSLSEVAQMLGVAKSTIQTHVDRALASLRESMGVTR